MRKYLLQFFLLTLVSVSTSVNAETISMQDLPVHVSEYINNKHPQATDLTVVEKTHFGQSLYEVNFKERKVDKKNQPYEEEIGELFMKNGHFFAKVITIDKHAFNILPEETEASLQALYPGYEILEVRSISNPNGVGEEYEIDLLVSGEIFYVSINDRGEIINETTTN